MIVRAKKQTGFTLIEVIVVLVIISIMASLIIPNILDRPDDARVTIAKADIRSISSALELYKLDNLFYPTTEQGLEALVNKPLGSPEPKNWSEGGYLKKLPSDPWGNPYNYISPGLNGAFDIYSYGADGQEGGEGTDADIKSWELP